MVVHRDYQDTGVSIIKIFDDRIEFFNPGRLYGNLTVEQLLSGNYSSKPRNRAIANMFKEAGIIERYGSGIARIAKLCQEHGVTAPTFEEFQHGFRVTVYKEKLESVNGGVNELLALITVNPGNSSRQLVETLGVSQRTLERWLKQLKYDGKIEFRGSSKTGGYYAKKD